MPLLDYVMKMQQQGIADKEIAKTLREKGFSPKEVVDAISQSKIKLAISAGEEQNPIPNYQENTQEQQYTPEQYPSQQYPQYSQQQYYQPQIYQPESARETAEEVTEEKISNIREQISSLSQLKKEFEVRTQDLDRRLKAIENSLEKIQFAILGKIAEYSKDLKNITTEMQATQETFKKVLNPVVDKVRNKKK